MGHSIGDGTNVVALAAIADRLSVTSRHRGAAAGGSRSSMISEWCYGYKGILLAGAGAIDPPSLPKARERGKR